MKGGLPYLRDYARQMKHHFGLETEFHTIRIYRKKISMIMCERQ